MEGSAEASAERAADGLGEEEDAAESEEESPAAESIVDPIEALDATFEKSRRATTTTVTVAVTTTTGVFWRLYEDVPGRVSSGKAGRLPLPRVLGLSTWGLLLLAAVACTGLVGVLAAWTLPARARRRRQIAQASLFLRAAKESLVDSVGQSPEEAEVATSLTSVESDLE